MGDTVHSIHTRMAAILKDFPVVEKGKTNPSHGYSYRGIDDALGHAHALFAKHGVYLMLENLVPVFSDGPVTRSGSKQVRCVLTGSVAFVASSDGSAVRASLVGEGVDGGDKALMKALANGLKYILWYTFVVPTDEVKDSEAFTDDGDAAEPVPAKSEPKKRGPGRAKFSKTDDTIVTEATQHWLLKMSAAGSLDELRAMRDDLVAFMDTFPVGNTNRAVIAEAAEKAKARFTPEKE